MAYLIFLGDDIMAGFIREQLVRRAKFWILHPKQPKWVCIGAHHGRSVAVTQRGVNPDVQIYITNRGTYSFVNFVNTSNKTIKLTPENRILDVMFSDEPLVMFVPEDYRLAD
jgi:hypothetical protein